MQNITYFIFNINKLKTVFTICTSPKEEGQNPVHAVYRGHFKGNGRAAFTSTILGNHHDSVGFTGHIIQGDSHYILQPLRFKNKDPLTRKRRSSSPEDGTNSSTSVVIPHKLYKVDENLDPRDNATHSDVAHVPRDELEKAFEEMNANNSADCSTSTISPDITDDDDNQDDDSDVTIEGDQETDDATLGNTFAEPNTKNKKKIGKKSQKQGRNKSKSNGKKSASSSSKTTKEGSKIVEISVFADSKLTKVWDTRFPKEGKTRLRGFILSLINNMNLLYQQASLGMSLSYRLVHLEMLSGTPAGLDSSGGEATKYLKSFCKYAGSKNEKGNQWDHALLLTGHDIKEAGDKLVAGMAWFSTMCLRYWSCSVSEGTSFSTAFILTHELGHSLGMEHDGSGVSKACESNKYIMSPTTGAGKTTWSSCSSTNLKDFIATGSPEVGKKDTATVPACLSKPSALKNQQIKYSSGPGKLPGQLYGLKVQCNYECGNVCSPSTVKAHQDDVCSMLWCEKAVTGGKQIQQAHPALEGSPCGSGKYCRYGKCVKSR
ncbi:A disintegrin and metalloproteinase with thrombospondin motifs 18 [Folsomia candida]|uniref:A disintegrin and metalloproteinase with thrombospondin motifs 18 n=1 Tax=Folsomia candida TaxID=158441 RepID=A0A226DJY6_FOLCA|nr:A disintegrin and metalloproteinase with thrombospondin motifs 18 [Folsomia candida]